MYGYQEGREASESGTDIYMLLYIKMKNEMDETGAIIQSEVSQKEKHQYTILGTQLFL